MEKFKRALFIFRRDLRLEDNTALNAARERSSEVIPAFIFDPRQVGNNPYKSQNALRFMLESLNDLRACFSAKKGMLYLFEGEADQVVKTLIPREGIDAVFVNRDYTPFSRERDTAIAKVCRASGAAFESFDDLLLQNPDVIRTNDGGVYKVYSAFLKKAQGFDVKKPRGLVKGKFSKKAIKGHLKNLTEAVSLKDNPSVAARGGRTEAQKILRRLNQWKKYDKTRDVPALEDGTTHLSAHHKFGTVSIREVYWRTRKLFGPSHTLIRELYWRDFFTYIACHFPHVFKGSFHQEYDKIEWEESPAKFRAWGEGRTGFPIVDAGMRQLNETGFMHNRVRMITASFLVKDLHIDWRKGEKYFARQLIDYDPSVNNGNWQWAASTGCDAQPYFRIFNPWRQQDRFDPECEYIKRWVPELRELSSGQIHRIAKDSDLTLKVYPRPVCDHRASSQKAKALFTRFKSKK